MSNRFDWVVDPLYLLFFAAQLLLLELDALRRQILGED